MTPLLIIVNGSPASGKTTLAKLLAERLGLELLSKDDFKETLYDEAAPHARRLLNLTHELGARAIEWTFHEAQERLREGESVVIEAPFLPEYDAERLERVLAEVDARAVQVLLYAPPDEIRRRYEERALSGERHEAHGGVEVLPDLERWLERGFEGFDVNPTFHVDATDLDAVDVEGLANSLREMGEKGEASPP